jgi:hypothetical protein
MEPTLLDQFLSEECTPYVRSLLEEALASASSANAHFDFNRFEVSIRRQDGEVHIENVLDASDAGVQRVSLGEFASSLARCSGA